MLMENDVVEQSQSSYDSLGQTAIFSGQAPEQAKKKLGKGGKIAIFVGLGVLVIGAGIGAFLMSRPRTDEEQGQIKEQEQSSKGERQTGGSTRKDKEKQETKTDEGKTDDKKAEDEQKSESKEQESQQGQQAPENPTPTPAPEPEQKEDTELVNAFRNAYNPYAGYHLYESASASSEQDAMDKIRALGRTDSIFANRSDDLYNVIRGYEDSSGTWISENWFVYKDSVFDVASGTINTSNSYFWGHADRLKNLFDKYFETKKQSKTYSSGTTEDSGQYTYTYQYLVGIYNEAGSLANVKLYKTQVFINKQSGKCTFTGDELVKETIVK